MNDYSKYNKMFSVGAIHPFNSPLAPPSNRNRSFGFWAFTPNPSAQNPKQKNKFMIIK